MSISLKFSDSSFESFEFPAHPFNHGISMPLTYSEDRRHNPGSPVFHDMSIERYANALSPLLNSLCARGKYIEEIRIGISTEKDAEPTQEQHQSDDADNKYEYILSKCLLTSVSVGGSATPMEQLTISFQHITWNYITTRNIVTTAEWSVVVAVDNSNEM